MFCPECGSTQICVNDVLHADSGSIYRYRRCNDCGTGFRTVETVIRDCDSAHMYEYSAAYEKRHPRRERKRNV